MMAVVLLLEDPPALRLNKLDVVGLTTKAVAKVNRTETREKKSAAKDAKRGHIALMLKSCYFSK